MRKSFSRWCFQLLSSSVCQKWTEMLLFIHQATEGWRSWAASWISGPGCSYRWHQISLQSWIHIRHRFSGGHNYLLLCNRGNQQWPGNVWAVTLLLHSSSTCPRSFQYSTHRFAVCSMLTSFSSYHPRDVTMNSETYRYKRGANQTLAQSTHVIEPVKFSEEEVQLGSSKDVGWAADWQQSFRQ